MREDVNKDQYRLCRHQMLYTVKSILFYMYVSPRVNKANIMITLFLINIHTYTHTHKLQKQPVNQIYRENFKSVHVVITGKKTFIHHYIQYVFIS